MSPICDDLDPFFDGELPDEAAGAFRDHLGGCERCQRVLHGRMLEAAVIAASGHAERAGSPVLDVVPLRPKQQPWLPRWGWAPLLAAAAAAVIVWKVKPGPRPQAPAEPPAIALALKQARGVDVRFSDPELDRYRERDGMRSGRTTPNANEEIGLQELSELQQRNKRHALVGALALNGDLEGAARGAGKLPESAATLSDRAALALLDRDADETRANAERALSLAVRARRLDPTLEQAIWNEAVALERLGLTRAAAATFDELAERGTKGWAAEARQRATDLRNKYEGDSSKWKQLQDAVETMERGGAVLDGQHAEHAPSVARKALHVAIAATADRARLAALASLAETLELSPELERVRASNLELRKPIAARFAQALAKDPVAPAELRAIRVQARRAGLEDIARTVALVIREQDLVADDVRELENLTAAGAWWRLVAVRRLAHYFVYLRRSYADADLVARDTVEACRIDGRERDPYWCSRILRTVAAANAEIGRLDRAYDLIGKAHRLTDEARERQEEARVFSVIGQIAATRVADWIEPSTVSAAYLRESDSRLSHCWSRLFLLDFPAQAALAHHRFAEAERLLADADRLNQTQCKDVRYNAEDIRLRLILRRPTAERVADLERRLQSIEDSHKDLDPKLRLFGQYLLARGQLAVKGDAQAELALQDVIAKAQALADDGDPRAVRMGGYSALAEHAARRGEADRTLTSIAARMGVELDGGCAVGINHDDRVTVVMRGPDGRTEAAIREVPEGKRVLDAQELLPDAMRHRLAGCERIDVLATGPYFGVPGLLGPELRWAYRSSPRRQTEPLRLDDQVVVTDVQAPTDLHFPVLRRMKLGGARTLEGAAATPDRVLNAISEANLAVINAHGITDANEPSAASLVLSPDPKQKGSYWLTAERVRRARFSRSPVIILAACHAGRVQVSAEPWSLASSFLAAGARAIIAPTTEIPDKDANEVFESIIRRMQSGSSPEQAVAKEREERGSRSPWLASVVVFQ